jgi:hypothetical protein
MSLNLPGVNVQFVDWNQFRNFNGDFDLLIYNTLWGKVIPTHDTQVTKIQNYIRDGENIVLVTDHEPNHVYGFNSIMSVFGFRASGDDGRGGRGAVVETSETRPEFKGVQYINLTSAADRITTRPVDGIEVRCQYEYAGRSNCIWYEMCVEGQNNVQLIGSAGSMTDQVAEAIVRGYCNR